MKRSTQYGKLSGNVLTEQGGKTTLTMTVLYQSREARDGALSTGMEQGVEERQETSLTSRTINEQWRIKK